MWENHLFVIEAEVRSAPQKIEFCGGDYTGVVPPVPISNTEVKYSEADDSVMNAKVGSRHHSTQWKNRPEAETEGRFLFIENLLT